MIVDALFGACIFAAVIALLPPGNVKIRFFVAEAKLPTIKIDDVVGVHCDGCAEGLTAKISFISRSSEFTPPVIYSLEERNKLVFMIEARPDQPEKFRVGQPVTVSLSSVAAKISSEVSSPGPAQ